MYIKQLIEKSRVNSKNFEKLQDEERDYLLTINNKQIYKSGYILL